MNTALYRNLLLLLSAGLCLIGGCATLEPVNIADESGRTTLAKGDTVVVTTVNGETHSFKIVDITADGIHGKELSIPYSDIRLLQIRRVDSLKTVLLTLGVIGVGVIAADSGGSDGGGY
ncbi:MAG TPA: hypothetical protein VFX02_12445 [Gammaproteobacteria bacterium]|nr:hypothetical protein [Gammaproteobacteria bacterium]